MALKTTTSEEVQAHINSSSKDFEILGTELALSLLYGVPYPSLDNALRSTTSLNTLTLFLESIVPSHGILNALQDNKSVQTLHAIFAEDSFDGALSKLGQSFGSLLLNTKTITTLKLEFALRSQNCVQDFCNGLSANQSLTSLSMIECFVDDNALSAIVPALKHNTTLKSLDLSSTSLGMEGCKHLGEILRTNISLSNLTLRKPYNKVPSEGWKYIFEGLKTNTALTELDISQNKITDIQVCNYMNDMFLYNKTLMHIDMNGNKIGSAGLNLMLQDLDIKPPLRLTTINLHDTKLDSACCEVLCNYVSVNENMMELDLSYNNIQAEGCKWIGTMLANNKTLTVLNMTNNKIGSQGAQWLASGLRVNRRLIDLVLQDCGITSDGCTHIAHALALNPCVMHVNLNGNDIGAQGCSALVTAMHTNHSVTALSITKDRKISDVSLNELIDAQNRNKIIHRTQLVNVMTTLINMARMTDDIMSVFPLEIWQRIFKQCVCGGVPGFDQIAMDLFTGLVDCRDIAQLVKMKIVRKRGKSILVKPSTSKK